jgi:uncharacterized protein
LAVARALSLSTSSPVAPDDQHHRKERFARIRRVKNLLRYMPRRARFHKYPLIGRFASLARKRSYLWSFKTAHIRPAIYAGTILAFMPLLGAQLPLALALAFLLRANFMLLGGLQFITNFFTAAPIYIGTHQLGRMVIDVLGFGGSIEVSPETPDALVGLIEPQQPDDIGWTQHLGNNINALIIGGLIVGLVTACLLDFFWRLGVRQAAAHRLKVLARNSASGSPVTPPVSK